MDTARPKLVDSLYGVHVKSVTCGEYQTCAVTSSGELYTWGDNSFGAELVGEEKKRSHWLPKRICGALDGVKISYVACAEWHTAVVSTSGQLFTYGDGTFGVLGHGNLQSVAQPREVESLRGLRVKCVACGPWHTAAVVEIIIDRLKFNNPGGKLFTWGDGDKGRLGHPGEETKLLPTCVAKLVDRDFIQVSCASTLTIALSSTGKRIAQSSRTSTLENHSPRPLPIAQKAVTREKVEREEATTTSTRMVSTKNYATENNQCFDRRGVNSLGESRQFSDPVTSLLDSFPRWGQVPCPEFFRRDYGHMRTQNHHPRASASPAYLQQIPVESLKRLCGTRKEKIQESQQKVEEAWSVAKEEASKSKAAKGVIKALTSRVTILHNNVNGRRIVVPTCVPLANTQLEDKNIDSLCGSPIVFSSALRSFYNKENNVDSKSAEESRKEADHGQAELRTSKAEWVEQYQLGVFITLTVLPSGKKGLNHCFDNVIKTAEMGIKPGRVQLYLIRIRNKDHIKLRTTMVESEISTNDATGGVLGKERPERGEPHTSCLAPVGLDSRVEDIAWHPLD
ncbi:hypothetical protein BC332_05070 [Capsicum chinense]|nr:hypothetical protein BC332_05070 [Capsicum chinense]